jgi:hypothetical protein
MQLFEVHLLKLWASYAQGCMLRAERSRCCFLESRIGAHAIVKGKSGSGYVRGIKRHITWLTLVVCSARVILQRMQHKELCFLCMGCANDLPSLVLAVLLFRSVHRICMFEWSVAFMRISCLLSGCSYFRLYMKALPAGTQGSGHFLGPLDDASEISGLLAGTLRDAMLKLRCL